MERKNFWAQNKKTLKISLSIVIAILLFLLLNWFWSLGAVASIDIERIRAEAVEGHAEWKRSNESEWRELSGAAEVSTGDSVRTGDHSRAEIRWGDRGVTRLDPNTEVVLEEAPKGDAVQTALLRVRVEGGRVWSRMLKMIDIGEGMQVRTNDVVATIRGTAFGVAKENDHSEAAVTDSVVDVSSVLLREGQWGAFDQDGHPTEVRQLTDADAWAVENKKLDRAFDEALLRELEMRFKQRADGVENVPVWMLRLSEQLHLSLLAGNKKEVRQETYALRHLALLSEAKSFDANRKTAEKFVAGQSMSGEFQNELHALISLSLSGHYAGEEMKFSADQLASLQELRSRLAGSDENALTIKAVGLDEKIDELLYGAPPEGMTAGTLLAEIADFVDEVKRSSTLHPKTAEQLVRRAEAMGYRLGFEGFGNDISSDTTFDEKALEEVAPAEPVLLDENGEVIKPANPTGADARAYQRLTLFASPSRVKVGDEVRLTLYGVTAAGETAALNADAIWGVVPPGEGQILNKATFIPSSAGQTQMSATYQDAEGARTVFATVQVEERNATGYSGLRFSFQTSLTASCGSKLPFKVLALYDDGSEKDVTTMSSKSVSDPNVIYVQDDSVVAYCPGQEASAQVFATYMEDGIRHTAEETITVVPDPASGGGATSQPSAAGSLLLY